MNEATLRTRAETAEARLLLRWAARNLSRRERVALGMTVKGGSDGDAAKLLGVTRQAVQQARVRACERMRRELERAGVRRLSDVLEAA